MTNAFKHGRTPDGRCAVTVRVMRTHNGFAFEVSDRSPGVPAEPTRKGSMGQTLIAALLRQLRATRTVRLDGGTTTRVEVAQGGG